MKSLLLVLATGAMCLIGHNAVAATAAQDTVSTAADSSNYTPMRRGRRCHPNHRPRRDGRCMQLFLNNYQTINFNCAIDSAWANGWTNRRCRYGRDFFDVYRRSIRSRGNRCSGDVRVCFY